jgi:hypothetical protein
VGVTSVNSLLITVLVPVYLSHCSKDFFLDSGLYMCMPHSINLVYDLPWLCSKPRVKSGWTV